VKSTARKKSAVRMFTQAVRIAIRHCEDGVSGMASGRLATNLRMYIGKLNRLAQDDPDNLFWPILQKAILKLVKYVRDSAR
jgi:hypothetical protein